MTIFLYSYNILHSSKTNPMSIHAQPVNLTEEQQTIQTVAHTTHQSCLHFLLLVYSLPSLAGSMDQNFGTIL